MKNLKYIKLFEAFESNILSKTLKYIKSDKDSKDKFLNTVRTICKIIDFPFSKLSDEYFEYLPFKKALEKHTINTDEVCTATSKDSYPDFAVDGSVCDAGMVKRHWGKSIRNAKCIICDGTGIKKNKNNDIKLIKFWFNSEGKYITNTAVDGIKRESAPGGTFTEDINNYNIVRKLSAEELYTIPSGSVLKVRMDGRDIVCYLYTRGGSFYILNKTLDGDTPGKSTLTRIPELQSWAQANSSNNDYYNYSWSWSLGTYIGRLGSSLNRENIYLLSPKLDDNDNDEVDLYSMNVGMKITHGSTLSVYNTNLRGELKDANFAIILDFGKLKESGYMRHRDIYLKRSEMIKGSKVDPQMTNDEIKKVNIERYLDKIASNIDVSNISNISNIVSKTIRYNKALFTLLNYNTDYCNFIDSILSNYFSLIKSSEEGDTSYVNRLLVAIKDKFSRIFKENSKKEFNINKNLEYVRKFENKDIVIIFKMLDEISKTVYQKISSIEAENIDDLKLIYLKLRSIQDLFNSSLYQHVRTLNSLLISRLSYESGFDYQLNNYIDYASSLTITLKELESIKKNIDRL